MPALPRKTSSSNASSFFLLRIVVRCRAACLDLFWAWAPATSQKGPARTASVFAMGEKGRRRRKTGAPNPVSPLFERGFPAGAAAARRTRRPKHTSNAVSPAQQNPGVFSFPVAAADLPCARCYNCHGGILAPTARRGLDAL